ncbi:MAG: phosphatase [Bacteroidetes bacterium]|nr:phosphatase [Bacteroidota bacterium]
MQMLEKAIGLFEALGGRFVAPVSEITQRLDKTRALVFDWDGVFNDGSKGEGLPSTFNEADTAGINILRFAVWLQTGQVLPVAIISGQQNSSALTLTRRDHYSAVYFRMANKASAVKHLAQQLQCKTSELTCMYDDTIDLSMAALCGLRILVNRPSAPVFRQFVADKGLAEYITGNASGRQPIREAMELLLLLTGQADKAYTLRTHHDSRFVDYTRQRNQLPFWGAFTESEGRLQALEG